MTSSGKQTFISLYNKSNTCNKCITFTKQNTLQINCVHEKSRDLCGFTKNEKHFLESKEQNSGEDDLSGGVHLGDWIVGGGLEVY